MEPVQSTATPADGAHTGSAPLPPASSSIQPHFPYSRGVMTSLNASAELVRVTHRVYHLAPSPARLQCRPLLLCWSGRPEGRSSIARFGRSRQSEALLIVDWHAGRSHFVDSAQITPSLRAVCCRSTRRDTLSVTTVRAAPRVRPVRRTLSSTPPTSHAGHFSGRKLFG